MTSSLLRNPPPSVGFLGREGSLYFVVCAGLRYSARRRISRDNPFNNPVVPRYHRNEINTQQPTYELLFWGRKFPGAAFVLLKVIEIFHNTITWYPAITVESAGYF